MLLLPWGPRATRGHRPPLPTYWAPICTPLAVVPKAGPSTRDKRNRNLDLPISATTAIQGQRPSRHRGSRSPSSLSRAARLASCSSLRSGSDVTLRHLPGSLPNLKLSSLALSTAFQILKINWVSPMHPAQGPGCSRGWGTEAVPGPGITSQALGVLSPI